MKVRLFQLLLSAFLFVTGIVYSQAPQGIPYQAIARNSSGTILSSTSITVRFTIRDSIATGTIKYRETHSVTTSAQAMFSVNIGQGTPVTGTFSGINWGSNAKFLQVEMDPAGGSSYIDMGTTQMMSVPYAMYSGNALVANSVVSTPQFHQQIFTVSGTFVTSANVNPSTAFKVSITAGGGAGSHGYAYDGCGYSGGGGGGAGGTAIYWATGLLPSTAYSVKVGLGGIADTSGITYAGTYANGDTSSFTIGSLKVFATGGKSSGIGVDGGEGGVSYNGNININGGDGGSGLRGCTGVAGMGGMGGSSIYGGGQRRGGKNAYGAGGGGGTGLSTGTSGTGANGTSGIVIIEWVE